MARTKDNKTESFPKECLKCNKPYIAYKINNEDFDSCPHCKESVIDTDKIATGVED